MLVIRPQFRPAYASDATRGRKYDFVSGRINSRGKVAFTYGSAAARIKMSAGAGLWPAFWLLGDGPWPATGEIDIMEYVGESGWVSQAVHGPGYSGDTPIANRFTLPKGSDATAWHVYSVDWSDSEMIFKVDGHEVYRATKAMIEEHGDWAFDNPKFVIVNFALGGTYPQGVNKSAQTLSGTSSIHGRLDPAPKGCLSCRLDSRYQPCRRNRREGDRSGQVTSAKLEGDATVHDTVWIWRRSIATSAPLRCRVI